MMSMRQWARRAAAFHHELGELADVASGDPRWWLIAGGAALDWSARASYVASDGDPAGDTLIGIAVPPPHDPIADAIARAHAARAGLRELDGALPDQPLGVTLSRTAAGAAIVPSALEHVAFAIGDRAWSARLAARPTDEHQLARDLAAVIAGDAPAALVPIAAAPVPFVTVTLGDEPLATARHGHRRAWVGNGIGRGPWLGLGHADGLAVATTCHMVIDGYGHARLAARIALHTDALAIELGRAGIGAIGRSIDGSRDRSHATAIDRSIAAAPVAGAIPLGIAWRPLAAAAPRALPLAYALGCLLHRRIGRRGARFSPTIQIPVAPGERTDPDRRRRRVVPAIVSVRFDDGQPEPYDQFAARSAAALAREARGKGLLAHLLAAARAAPAPLAWKRRAIGGARPSWLEPVANLIGGRACVSRMLMDLAMPPACAVSSPARRVTADDPVGGCVVTVIDDGARAGITVCGSDELATQGLLDEVLAAAAVVTDRPARVG